MTKLQHKTRKYSTTIWLCLLIGGAGAHRFYTGYIGIGIAQLIIMLSGLGYIWSLIDLYALYKNKFRDADGQVLEGFDTKWSNVGRGLAGVLLGLIALTIILAVVATLLIQFTHK